MSIPPDPPGTADVVQTLAKAVISVVPIAGGPAAELLDLLRLPAAARQYAWLEDLAERLKHLEAEKRLTVDDVVRSDAFVSATMRGLDAARRTADDEKRAALRNGVLNVAIAQAPDEASTQLFLDWIDRFTPWHLALLRATHDPRGLVQSRGLTFPGATSTVGAVLAAAFPELASRRDLYELIWSELYQAGLVQMDLRRMNETSSDIGWWPSRTTQLGAQFLRFIDEPLANS